MVRLLILHVFSQELPSQHIPSGTTNLPAGVGSYPQGEPGEKVHLTLAGLPTHFRLFILKVFCPSCLRLIDF